jgi:hypothetical protein
LRNLIQIAAYAPDGDAVADDYRKLAAHQYKGKREIATQPGSSQIGITWWTGTYNDKSSLTYAPWQVDFDAGHTNGHAMSIDPGFIGKQHEDFEWCCKFMARSIVGRFGDTAGFHISKAGSYTLQLSDMVRKGTWISPPSIFYKSWDELFVKNFGATYSRINVLPPEITNAASQGMWGIAVSGLAQMATHNMEGARQAWKLLKSMDNAQVLFNPAMYRDKTQWGIEPLEEAA